MKKITLIAIPIFVIIFIAACVQNEPIACTADAKICPDGSAVGRSSPDCEFAPCPESNDTKCDYTNDEPKYATTNAEECTRVQFQCDLTREPFFDECGCGCKLKENVEKEQANATEEEPLNQNFCQPEQRNAGACIQLYDPVCGWFDSKRVQCIKAPCADTYSNSCFACMDDKVSYWTEGECGE